MKKFSRRWQYPLMISIVMPTMLVGMPGIMAYRTLSAGDSLLSAWASLIGQMVPPALLMLAVVAPTVRIVVTKLLLEPEDRVSSVANEASRAKQR